MANILIASDAQWIHDDVKAALGQPGAIFRSVKTGQMAVSECQSDAPDLAVIDLQIGNMGGFAVCHELRLMESVNTIGHVPVLLLLDRAADLFIAQRSEADGWLVKPLDAFRLRKAGMAILAGGTFYGESAVTPEVLAS